MIAVAAQPNRLKAALWEGRPQRGLFSVPPGESGFSEAGLDCVICEAGEIFARSGFAALQADSCEIAVCADSHARLVLQSLLRKGIQNIVLTGIAGPSDARAAIMALHRRPDRRRLSAGDRWRGMREENETHADGAEICALALVDGAVDMENLVAIAQMQGLSGLILDPVPAISQERVCRIAHKIRSLGKAPGIVIPHDAEPEYYFACGFLFVARREGHSHRGVASLSRI
ncbi:hypothetical protein [Martelella soudanensis]|uniref:hypothetical protein n=1 Tax=unclassified Martelella TaxID=2629616 RepID=UPI0015DE6CEC|nr:MULTISPECIES: hypothetical protein [unclassified Martelella]